MKAFYVAGPYGKGEAVEANVRRAVEAAEEISGLGGYPFVPHLAKLWSDAYPEHSYEFWMDWDAEWLTRCDAVLRIPGASPGADREVSLAVSRGMPVFYDLPTLGLWLRGSRAPSDLVNSGEWLKPATADGG